MLTDLQPKFSITVDVLRSRIYTARYDMISSGHDNDLVRFRHLNEIICADTVSRIRISRRQKSDG